MKRSHKKNKQLQLAAAILLASMVLIQGCQKDHSAEPASSVTQAMEESSAEVKDPPPSASDSGTGSSAAQNPPEELPAGESSSSETGIPQDGSPAVEPVDNITVAVPLSSAPGSIPSPSVSGKLHVEGARLCGSNGQPVQLKGISTHGIAWFPGYINEDCFAQFRTQWDVNVMRLAMYTAEYNGYCSGGDQNQLKTLVRNGVKYATDHDMYVIIDWHILSDSNPNQHISEAGAFFDEMSKEYAGHNNVLYEICNEPNGGTSWSDIKTYAADIIDIIRKNDKDAVIIVGTPNWSQYVDEAAKDPITGSGNIMYALHFYAATHKDDLRNRMVSAIQAGLPIFVTEYGICDASGSGNIDRAEADQWVSLMNLYDISYVAWNLSNKNETSAILNSSCTKTSGFTENDLSESGRWLHDMLTAKSLPAASAPPSLAGQPQPGRSNADTFPDISVTDDTFQVTGTIVIEWTDQGQRVCQYSLVIRNISGADCTNWTAEIPFPGGFTLMDGWNGDYSAVQDTLRITAKDYNRNISSGGTVSDVGFIVKLK